MRVVKVKIQKNMYTPPLPLPLPLPIVDLRFAVKEREWRDCGSKNSPYDLGFSRTLSHFFLLSRYTFSQSDTISSRCTHEGRISGFGSRQRRMMFARLSGHVGGMVGRRF